MAAVLLPHRPSPFDPPTYSSPSTEHALFVCSPDFFGRIMRCLGRREERIAWE
uniref:Uncharacterized protein n=1 Tax=Arundo donax TaxID=35708 RepID=A0A0A9CBF8_ARUDO